MEPAVPYEIFGPEQQEFRRAVRSFVEKELLPHAEEWDKEQAFPREVFNRFGELGFFGLKYPAAYGGSLEEGNETAGWLADVVLTEEISGAGSGGVAAALGASKDLFALHICKFGTEEQRQRWLVPAITGEIIGALAVTEPGAGSDVAAIETRASREGDGWVLSGTKVFITNGTWADAVVVAAKTDPAAGYGGISLFVVEKGTPGFSARRIHTLGWRTSQTAELSFQECRLAADSLLGREGQGFYNIMQNFVWERLAMSLGAVAGADRVYKMAKDYALTREIFGRPIGKHQVWRHRFAEMATSLEEARRLTYHALRLYLAGESAVREAAMAKLHSSEVAFRISDECVQVLGGYGYMMEYPAQRAWRDLRLNSIGGGTSQIMREIIARAIGV
ncbi:MAG: acyl-CoA dehydrogenase family protein [Actinomycetota bacterium]